MKQASTNNKLYGIKAIANGRSDSYKRPANDLMNEPLFVVRQESVAANIPPLSNSGLRLAITDYSDSRQTRWPICLNSLSPPAIRK